MTDESGQQGFSRYRSTVLFCDIRGFTRFFDQRPPEETFEFVASVFGRMAKIIEGCQGRIANFTGDGFLAQFGSGADAPGIPETNAVNAAILVREELVRINVERHREHNFAFTLGIGINTGPLAAGPIRLKDSTAYLILGDEVNTAARIESLCKLFSVDILISESTEAALRGRYRLLPMPPHELRGKAGKHKTYWVMPTSKVSPQQ